MPSLWRRFVCYNWLPLLELNVEEDGGSETVTVLRKYTWGLDLAGQSGPGNSIDTVGGIGGLLATCDTAGSAPAPNRCPVERLAPDARLLGRHPRSSHPEQNPQHAQAGWLPSHCPQT